MVRFVHLADKKTLAILACLDKMKATKEINEEYREH
jgi:hypothetical protein